MDRQDQIRKELIEKKLHDMDLDDLIWEHALVITIVLAVLKAFRFITCATRLIWELALVITIVLAVLKAFGYITCSWLNVFMPVMYIVSIIGAWLLFYVFYCICYCLRNRKHLDELWLKYFSKRKSKQL